MQDKPVHVLLIEDNPGDVGLMRAMLDAAGGSQFVMEFASRLAAGLERIDSGEFDVVLLDLTLPDSHGFESFQKAYAHAPRIPIIVLSGLDDEELAMKTVQHGAQDYVVKGSVDSRLLVRAMRYAIERTRVQRALAEQRRLFSGLLDTIPDRIYFKDEKSRFLQINPSLAKFFKLDDPQIAVGKTDFDFFTYDHALPAYKDEQEVMRTGQPLIGKVEKETLPSGRTGWALTTKMPLRDDEGRIIGTFGISRDITELKEAEEALRDSEERYKRLLDSVTDYVYTVQLRNGEVVSTSHGPGCLGVTGYTPDEFRADSWLWFRIVHPDDRETVSANNKRMLQGDAGSSIEHRLIRRDGSVRWVRNKQVPRFDAYGRMISYDGLISDITERKNAEEQLREANARLREVLADLTKSHEELKTAQMQLIQAEKLQSVGQLAAGVAHEVKNPLAILNIGIGYLANPASDQRQADSVLKEMKDAVNRANTVIGGLLNYSSPKDIDMRDVGVNALIEESLRFVKHDLATAGVTVVTRLAPELPSCRLDTQKIEQALINIFTNACHAMSGGGTLTIGTFQKTVDASETAHDVGDRSGVRFRAGEKAVVIHVEDTGHGIPEEKLSKVFDPFFTTKPTGKGTGLGLTVTKKIVDLHGGRLNISNKREGGVAVTIMLKCDGGFAHGKETNSAG